MKALKSSSANISLKHEKTLPSSLYLFFLSSINSFRVFPSSNSSLSFMKLLYKEIYLSKMVEIPGVEPRTLECHSNVLPLYYIPLHYFDFFGFLMVRLSLRYTPAETLTNPLFFLATISPYYFIITSYSINLRHKRMPINPLSNSPVFFFTYP